MKTLISLLFALALKTAVIGQEFSFNLYLEDAAGYKDTLVFGYDANATDTVDIAFGEVNIISVPFGPDFEARIADVDFAAWEIYSPDATTFHTKTQIKKKDCTGTGFPLVSAILLSKAIYPVKVYWDSELFNDACLEKSLITDWYPNLWFDVLHGTEQGPFNLNAFDTVNFAYTTHHSIISVNDTIDLLFITLASVNNIIINVNEQISPVSLHVFPNPAGDRLFIRMEDQGSSIAGIQVLDLWGTEYSMPLHGDYLDCANLSAGIYLIRVTFDNGRVITRKFLKK